ncbi:hypothetical protein [Nocardia sp. NPDC058633]|uniref:hypothetical protein n=1 Tax=Nocardia sp. NPDC058633 TaxID=3346568 RepID=UPI00365AF3B5
MTPEEIRAEAIERVARADWERDRELGRLFGDAATWEELDKLAPGDENEWRVDAAVLVDALGDMLPIGEESRYLGRGLDRRARYVTAWREVRRG